jgi:hypothetical protein
MIQRTMLDYFFALTLPFARIPSCIFEKEQHTELSSSINDIETTDADWFMTQQDFANNSPECPVDNYMVRSLVNKLESTESIHPDDIQVATQILQRKFLIGLTDHMQESLQRATTYFEWDGRARGSSHITGMSFRDCKAFYLSYDDQLASHSVPHPQVSHDSNSTTASPEWTFWHDREWADMTLFNYATQLFDEQTILFGLPGSSPHQK